MKTKLNKINSHNEWDKLKEIIVGTAKGSLATLTWKKNKPPSDNNLSKAKKLAKKACPKWFYDEVEEDLDNLSITLKNFGVAVHRPKPFDYSNEAHLYSESRITFYNVRYSEGKQT